MMFQEKLYEKIKEFNNPSVVGLDPLIDYVPKSIINKFNNDSEAILHFNKCLIDNLKEIIPVVKCQSAYYELLGPKGAIVLTKTMEYAKKNGMLVILDCKRNDIGSTASAYANAYLNNGVYNADCITVNGYLGSDGITPFIDKCEKLGKGIYILVKTSNKSSFELQDLKLENGNYVYEQMASLVSKWGESTIGKYGYSSVGAVVGATYPKQLKQLREKMKHTIFLVPGYGVQGGDASDVKYAFDENGNGALVNSSRGIMCAWKKRGYDHEKFIKAAIKEANEMKNKLNKYIKTEAKK